MPELGSFRVCRMLFCLCIQTVAIASICIAADTEPVTIYTEDFPPYNFKKQQGKVEGVSVDLVTDLMEEAGLDYSIKLMPWPRAVREAEKDPKGLIFSIARIENREKIYDWLAYLTSPEFYLFARTEDMRDFTFDAIRRGEFTAICEDNDASCSILRDAGFSNDKLFRRGNGGLSEAVMIQYGRADLYLGDLFHHPYRLKELNLPNDIAKPVLRVGTGMRLYLAAGFHVDRGIRDKVREAYKMLVLKGVMQADIE
ncbi:MAG: substrate-binding periplasmic protein [Kordiimonas sp.]